MLDGSLIDEADFPRPITQRSAKMGGCQQNTHKGLEPMVLLLFRVVFCFVVWLWKTAETEETKKTIEADSESAVYLRIRPALSSFQVHTRTEVLTWSCLKPQFKDSVYCFFKDTNRPEQEWIFLISKTIFFKLVLDLIKEKPLSRRFTYLEELALKVVVLPSELEADTDEPE